MAKVVAGRTAVDSRIAMLRQAVVEFAIVAFNPTPIWQAVRDLFDVDLVADTAFVSLVERNGGAWITVVDGDDSYSAVVDRSSIPEGLELSAINEWHLAVVEATRDAKDYKIEKGVKRLRAYPILEE